MVIFTPAKKPWVHFSNEVVHPETLVGRKVVFVSGVLENNITRARERPKPALDSAARMGIVVGPNTITLVIGLGIRLWRVGCPVYPKIRVSMATHPWRGSMRNPVPMAPVENRVILDSRLNFLVVIGATCNSLKRRRETGTNIRTHNSIITTIAPPTYSCGTPCQGMYQD